MKRLSILCAGLLLAVGLSACESELPPNGQSLGERIQRGGKLYIPNQDNTPDSSVR